MRTKGSPILGNINIYSGGVNQCLSGKKQRKTKLITPSGCSCPDFSLDMTDDLDLQITSSLHSAALQYKRRIKKVKISVNTKNCALASYKLDIFVCMKIGHPEKNPSVFVTTLPIKKHFFFSGGTHRFNRHNQPPVIKRNLAPWYLAHRPWRHPRNTFCPQRRMDWGVPLNRFYVQMSLDSTVGQWKWHRLHLATFYPLSHGRINHFI